MLDDEVVAQKIVEHSESLEKMHVIMKKISSGAEH